MINAWALITHRRGRLFLQPYSQEKPGALFGTAPIAALAMTVSVEELGSATRIALGHSKQSVKVPIDHADRMRRRWRELGVSSEHELTHDARLVHVERTDASFTVVPTRNGGEQFEWNYLHLREMATTLASDATDEQLGEAILSSLERCEAVY